MTERQKLADLPQEQREQLVKKAADLGINTAMIANWYVDTLEAKIAEAEAKKAENAEGNGNAATTNTAAAAPTTAAAQTDADPTEPAVDENGNIDPTVEAQQLDKDTEIKPKDAKKAVKNTVKQICHICRSIVVNGKCTGCGFEIAKR